MIPFVPQKLPIPLKLEPLVPLIGAANRALASFDGVLHALRNPEIMLAPMTTKEAVLSSRIEGTQATFGEVLKYEAGEEPEQPSRLNDIFEIINYREALRMAAGELDRRPFHLNLLLRMHQLLLDSVRGRDKARGQFRTIQNWIGSAGTPIEQAQYVPPEPRQILAALDDWEKYYHSEQPDPLVQLAIVHAQFEIIHPFLDGNGRLGRILIPLYLFERQLLSRPSFYLSAYLEEHKDEYITRLRELTGGEEAWRSWVEFFLRAMIVQAKTNTETARRMIALYEAMKARIIDLTHSQFAIPLLDALFERPILSTSALEKRDGMPSRQMIYRLLNKLREDGVLRALTEARGRRGQVFAFTELMNICEGRDVFA